MPAWITHWVTAEKLNNKLKIKDKNSFLFGNIVPDILNNHFVKNTSMHKSYAPTHFAKGIIINGIECEFPDIYKFLEKYEDRMDNPVICGAFVHLVTDYFWNMNFRKEYTRANNDLTELKLASGEKIIDIDDKIVSIKHEDFRIFTEYLKRNYKLERIIYTDELVKYCSEIEEIPITKEDIINTLEIIEGFTNSKAEENNSNYKIYSQDKLEKYLEESVDFILDKIKSIVKM